MIAGMNAARVREPVIEVDSIFTPFDRAVSRVHALLFGRTRGLTLAATVALYGLGMVLLGNRLGVSANFMVVIPVIVAAVGYGLAGGLTAGFLGLPLNLALFYALGHPEYSPASKLAAELSGLAVGTSIGYLSDFYKKLFIERTMRKEMEDELRRALRDKEALFREVHHRVKNNLNLVKSLIGLQSRRSEDPAFKRAAADLLNRIMSISLIHEQLYRKAELSSVSMDEYLGQLVRSATDSAADPDYPPEVEVACARRGLSMDAAVPLGLAANEAITNALKHGRPRGKLRISVRFARLEDEYVLEVRDDGQGFPSGDGGPGPEEESGSKLGLTLMDILAGQLGGRAGYWREDGFTIFKLTFPAYKSGETD